MNAQIFETLRARCHNPEPDPVELAALLARLQTLPDAPIMLDYFTGAAATRFGAGDPGAWALLRAIHQKTPLREKMPDIDQLVDASQSAREMRIEGVGLMAELALADRVSSRVAVDALLKLWAERPQSAVRSADVTLMIIGLLWSGESAEINIAESLCAVMRGAAAWDAEAHAKALGILPLPSVTSKALFLEFKTRTHRFGAPYLVNGDTGGVMASRRVDFAELDRFVQTISPACAVASFVCHGPHWSDARRDRAAERLWGEAVGVAGSLGYILPGWTQREREVHIENWASRSPIDRSHVRRINLAAAESLLAMGYTQPCRLMLRAISQTFGALDPWAESITIKTFQRDTP